MSAHALTHYTAAEVAAATGIPPEKQLAWHERHVIIPSRSDVRPNGSGEKRLMSRDTVHQIGLAAEAIKVGIPVKPAAAGARLVTDRHSPGRPAGKLFPRDRTLIVFRPNGAAVVNAELDSEFSTLADGGASYLAIDCGKVFETIDAILESLK